MSEKQNEIGRKPKFVHSEPTLVDVAKVAGVSPITVSRALNQPDVVSEQTRQKVLSAVEATGYVPNMQAGSLASRNSRLVAVIVPTIAHSIFSSMVQSLNDTLAGAGYQTLLGLSGYDPVREENLIETILGRRPDGVVLTGTFHTQRSRKRLEAVKIPLVETWDMTNSPIDSVIGFSHQQVGTSVGDYLTSKGYRRVVAISADDERAQKRKDGLMSALSAVGIDSIPTVTVPAPTGLQPARHAVGELLENQPELEAIYCSSDTLAQGAISELQSRGLRIPDDVAVIGFGDLEFAAYNYPSITSVKINGFGIGQLSAQALLEQIKKPEAERKRVHKDVGFSIVERQSA